MPLHREAEICLVIARITMLVTFAKRWTSSRRSSPTRPNPGEGKKLNATDHEKAEGGWGKGEGYNALTDRLKWAKATKLLQTASLILEPNLSLSRS